jgi:acyl-CoA synthetase (AMP-forming)/AMP-acid ligase II
MLEEGLSVGGGATYFLTSLLDHPDFTAEHLALMPFAGLGGVDSAGAVTERATRLGMKVFRSYGSTEHPSITGCLLDDPEEKRLTTDGRALPGVEIRLDEHGEIMSRGPDCFLGYTDATLRNRPSIPTVGTAPATSGCSTPTATSRSPIVCPTSSSAARTSAPEIEELLLGMEGIAEVGVVAPGRAAGERGRGHPDGRRAARAVPRRRT